MTADIALVVVSNYEHAEAMAAFMEAPRKNLTNNSTLVNQLSLLATS
jgi:hypothetical protein